MNVITNQDAKAMGINSMPQYISSDEVGKNKGVGFRSGAANLLFWFDIIELKTGEFRRRDRHDLLGKSVEEVRAI